MKKNSTDVVIAFSVQAMGNKQIKGCSGELSFPEVFTIIVYDRNLNNYNNY